ncbi:MAG: hypothetical protein LBL13_10730 [Bacteroidales bacterium]|jgi:hypothetical protein|nr:hypothetical protein [Bacteroidales bacterium]
MINIFESAETTLRAIGNAIIILATAGIIFVIIGMVLKPLFEGHYNRIDWIVFSIVLISYFLTVGFGYLFKVVGNISENMELRNVSENLELNGDDDSDDN